MVSMLAAVLLLPLILQQSIASTITGEFCNMNDVNITCPTDYAIIIYKAQLGRMTATSRCITKPIEGYDGCRTDVINAMDKRCSGLQMCHFQLPDAELIEKSRKILGRKECPPDVTPYLFVEYNCIKVIPNRNLVCESNKALMVPTKEGHLSTAIATTKDLGSKFCPWKIQASSGQSINITVMNFYRHDINSVSEPCNVYGVITEGEGGKRKNTNIYVCNRDPKYKWIYTSATSSVEISFNKKISPTSNVALIHYKVSGCEDIASFPPHQLVARDGNQATITCVKNNAEETFYLTCKGTEWLGYNNCSKSLVDSRGHGGLPNVDQTFPYGLVIVVAIGVALGIFLGGILLLCVSIYMKKKYKQNGTYIRPDYEIEYNMRNTDNCLYPSTLPRHHDNLPSPIIADHLGNTDTIFQYMRCAKHGLTGIQENQFETLVDTENQLNNTANLMPPNRPSNAFNINRSQDHSYEHPGGK